uniref:uncharacterized protein LOC113475036 n=1 Tax=Ciona intestinalis TaxID=7719 RepID=UPI000EF4D833|nr:uncharacterized protein LOC113475036 [Ciona intestinalis]|eukprot:XP_026694245.1 uncharacterized protein LOC113475036 [Ciona intestinalis]
MFCCCCVVQKMWNTVLYVVLFCSVSVAAAENISLFYNEGQLNQSSISSCIAISQVVTSSLPNIDRIRCCNDTVTVYNRNWSTGRFFLTTFLHVLAALECPQFQSICERKTFVFDHFSALVYERYCDTKNLESSCTEILNNTISVAMPHTAAVLRQNRIPVYTEQLTTFAPVTGPLATRHHSPSWLRLVKQLGNTNLTLKQSLQPCVQVATYEAETKLGNFMEILTFSIPTCGVIWCGFNKRLVDHFAISAWDCMPERCRPAVVFILWLCLLLAVTISALNSTIILVYGMNPRLRNSQAIYKISLAVADLIAGVIILPTAISTLYRQIWTPYQSGSIENVTIVHQNVTFSTYRSDPVYQLEIQFPYSYRYFVGFFTSLSFSVSIYILNIAGFDRMMAVYKPLHYKKEDARILATKASIGVWFVASMFSLLPIFTDKMNYVPGVSFLMHMEGQIGTVIYLTGLLLPVISMWVISIATFCYARKHKFRDRHLSGNRNDKGSLEVRLARTLVIMVGMFSISLLPIVTIICCQMFLPSIHNTSPRDFNVDDATASNTAEFFGTLVLVCNSLWNFFIYSYRDNRFKKALKVLFIQGCCDCRIASWWGRITSNIRHTRKRLSMPSLTFTRTSQHTRKKSLPTVELVPLPSTSQNPSESNNSYHLTGFDSFKINVQSDKFRLSVLNHLNIHDGSK